jgi:hypothetical protein
MKRREFIAGLGSAAAWPLTARAQQGDRVQRIGVLMPGNENDPLAKARVTAFTQALADLGWTDGRNVWMDLRWHGDDNNRARALARDLVSFPLAAPTSTNRANLPLPCTHDDTPSIPNSILRSPASQRAERWRRCDRNNIDVCFPHRHLPTDLRVPAHRLRSQSKAS